MQNKFDQEQKKAIVAQYADGASVASLCAQHHIARSTLYFWINQFHPLKSSTDITACYREYFDLKRQVEKLETRLAIIRAVGCGMAAPLKEKLEALEKLYGQYSVHALCDALDVSRGTFYNHIFRRKDVTFYDKRREEIRKQVEDVFNENKQRLGAKKICAILADSGIRTSQKYVTELMREMGLQCIGRNAKREYKRQEKRKSKENFLQQQFNVSNPNEVWVSDITCFKIGEKFYYICVIIDLFSRMIIAHGVSSKSTTYLVTSTFRRAFETRMRPEELLFHSDRGVQYTSQTFRKLLGMNNIVQSFSKSGSPHDNAVAEAFFSSMKKEELYRINYKSEREFRVSVEEYIHYYNTKRPHASLSYKTPERAEEHYRNKQGNIA